MFVPCGPAHRKFRNCNHWVATGVLSSSRLLYLLASAEQNRDRVATAVTQTRDRPTAPRESESRVTTDRRLRAPSHPWAPSWAPGTTLAVESRCCDLPCVAEPPHSSRCLGAKPAYPECCQRVLRRLYGFAITEVFSRGLGGVARPAAGRVALPCSGAPCADGRASVRRRPLPRACAVGPCA